MLALTTVLAACTRAAPAAPAANAAGKPASALGGNADNGKQLFAAKGCIACHTAQGVPGATGTIGPNLNGIGDASKRPQLADGSTNTPEHIREWITDPNSKKPGTMMPNLQLNQQEATDLTAFLVTLTK
jgi:cytochrome c oxidase subunit 2